MNERKEGFYWVKLDDPTSPDWTVALWHDNDGGYDGGDWCWRSHHFDGKGHDSMFSEINENRIPDPNEGRVDFFGQIMTEKGSENVYIQLPVSVSLAHFVSMVKLSAPITKTPEQQANEFIKSIKK